MHAFFPPYVFKSASQCNCSTCGLLTEVFSHDRSRRWAVVTHACPAELHASQCPGHSSYGPLRQTPTARLSTGPGQTHGWQTAGRWSTPHSKVSFPQAYDRLVAGKTGLCICLAHFVSEHLALAQTCGLSSAVLLLRSSTVN